MPIGNRRTTRCEDSTDLVDSLNPRLPAPRVFSSTPWLTETTLRPMHRCGPPWQDGACTKNSPIPPSVHRPYRGEPWSTGTVTRSANARALAGARGGAHVTLCQR